MSQAITTEINIDGRWIEIGRNSPDDLPGSLTERCDAGRRMVVFGWFLEDETDAYPRPVVALTDLVAELDLGSHRFIAPRSTTVLADLSNGPYERTVLSDDAIPVRWSLIET